jgi:hypothetical protein
MKPFKILWDNKSLYPKATRMLGVTFTRAWIPGQIGLKNCLTFWLWKWFKTIAWISKKF